VVLGRPLEQQFQVNQANHDLPFLPAVHLARQNQIVRVNHPIQGVLKIQSDQLSNQKILKRKLLSKLALSLPCGPGKPLSPFSPEGPTEPGVPG